MTYNFSSRHVRFKTFEASAAPSRESLAALVRAFLASEMTAFELDEQLDSFHGSDDPVVQHVVEAVWYHYDDCDDHLVCLSKQQWDYFQRLLLVLACDCRVENQTEYRWSIKQPIALIALCWFAYFAVQSGWGQHLFILSMPFGIISIALAFWQTKRESNPNPYQAIIFPFASIADLATAYRSCDFRKTRYPKHIAERTIRSPLMSEFWQLHFYTMWLMLAPFPLLFQTFPETHTDTRIVMAPTMRPPGGC